MDNITIEKLNILVVSYKKSKSQKDLDDIFILLDESIKDKSRYVFYRQKYIKDKNEIKRCEDVKEEKEYMQCFFRLADLKDIDYDDIVQDLSLEIIRLINNYDGRAPFMNYYFASLKNWRPSYIRAESFLNRFKTMRETDMTSESSKESAFDNFPDREKKYEMEEIIPKNLSEIESKIIELLKENSKLNYSQLAARLKVTHQYISLVMVKLRKKIKKLLADF